MSKPTNEELLQQAKNAESIEKVLDDALENLEEAVRRDVEYLLRRRNPEAVLHEVCEISKMTEILENLAHANPASGIEFLMNCTTALLEVFSDVFEEKVRQEE